jgi:hypothetical protein
VRRSLLMVVLVAAPALAASPQSQPSPVTRAPDGDLLIASPPCSALVKGADYMPGLDADGKPVAPADLPREGPQPITADGISIRVSGRFAAQFAPPATAREKAIIGYVTVKDGAAYFNGEPLAPGADAAIVAACRGVAN